MLKNARTTLIAAAIAGTLVTRSPAGIANADDAGLDPNAAAGPDAVGFDPNLPPAPDAAPVDTPPAPEDAGFDPNLPRRWPRTSCPRLRRKRLPCPWPTA